MTRTGEGAILTVGTAIPLPMERDALERPELPFRGIPTIGGIAGPGRSKAFFYARSTVGVYNGSVARTVQNMLRRPFGDGASENADLDPLGGLQQPAGAEADRDREPKMHELGRRMPQACGQNPVEPMVTQGSSVSLRLVLPDACWLGSMEWEMM